MNTDKAAQKARAQALQAEIDAITTGAVSPRPMTPRDITNQAAA
jgi:hypothetical protein